MRTPLTLLSLSLAGAGGFYVIDGGALTLPLAVFALASIAALLIVARALLRRGAPVQVPAQTQTASDRPNRRRRRKADAGGHDVVVDGSNVMHWNAEIPRLGTLKEVIASLQAQGYRPGIIFDANAGYKLCDRYLDDQDFAKLLKLPADRVLVVPKGEPADPTILAVARALKAKVVTNDRFRDWADDFPEVATPGHLVQGQYRGGKLCLKEEALAA